MLERREEDSEDLYWWKEHPSQWRWSYVEHPAHPDIEMLARPDVYAVIFV